MAIKEIRVASISKERQIMNTEQLIYQTTANKEFFHNLKNSRYPIEAAITWLQERGFDIYDIFPEEKDALDEAYDEGYKDGHDEGYFEGFDNGKEESL